MNKWATMAAIALALALVLTAGEAPAQQGVCKDTPEPGGWIDCREPADSSADIDIDARNLTITTTDDEAQAIGALHEGAGDIDIIARDLIINTNGSVADGISASHAGEGDIDVDTRDVTIMTEGGNADGVYGFHAGAQGGVHIDVQNTDITTSGDEGEAILAIREGAGEIEILVRKALFETEGEGAEGVHGLHRGDGDVHIGVQNTEVLTMGVDSSGIRGSHGGTGAIRLDLRDVTITTEGRNADGVYGFHAGSEGDIRIRAQGGDVTTKGDEAEAILAIRQGAGEIEILVRNALIRTEGEGAEGVHGLHREDGEVRIEARGVEISTTGAAASGVRGSHGGMGGIDIYVRDTTISTTNADAHGILGYHGGSGSVRIAVDGGRVHAAGLDASGVRVGNADSQGQVTLAAEVGEDGYRKQSVTVNAPVTGGSGRDAAGVFLAGGGRVVIGPRGSLGAESRIAIRAAGDAPRLHVDMNLDGRRVTQVIGESFIHNHEGETTLLINGVMLHDGEAGATGIEAPNGAWDVTLLEKPTVTGRIFSHNDFNAVYAPRAAVYEALPGLLLRLNGRGPAGKRIASPDSPVWVSLSNGKGSYEAERASVGAKYDFNHFGAEAGVSFSLGENLSGSASVRYINGSAEVESPVGNGDIKAQGIGAAFGASWSNSSGYYADGRTALIDYDVDASSEKRGQLTRNAGALGYSVGIEAGMRVALGEKIKLTPRAWMMGAGFLNAVFTDVVNSRISLDDSRRFKGGLGLIAETARTWEGGSLSLRVLLDVEQALGDGGTTTVVSGEKLSSESAKTRVLLGLGGAYRQGPFSLGAELSAGGLGSDDEEYSGRVDFGMKF